jgi:hypothetical protein
VNALAKDEVGRYLNRHFVSAFQRVGTFRVAGAQKQGGNVASYFCTSDGLVLHAIACPVDEAAFLREARWAVDTCNLAILKNLQSESQLRSFFRNVHLERLQTEHGVAAHDPRYPTKSLPIRDWKSFWDYHYPRIGNNQGKVHLLLASTPLPRIADVYQKVFSKILNERISINPVAVVGG